MRQTLRNLWLPAVALLLAACGPGNDADFDVIIRGGTVYDGLGGDPYVADIAIVDDRIVAIGDLAQKTGRDTIDARNLAVSPGFINMLSWATESLIKQKSSGARAISSTTSSGRHWRNTSTT